MIRAHLDPMSVSRIRWALSPVLETVGLMALTATGRSHPIWGDPGAAARYAMRDPAVSATAALARGHVTGHYMPDFLTPKPSPDGDGESQLHGQLDRVRSTPPDSLADQLGRMGRSEAPSLSRVAAAGLHTFWRLAVADRWPAMRLQLREHQERHIRAAATQGIGTVLNALHPGLRWEHDQLVVDKPYAEQVRFADAELVLVPTMATWPRLVVQLCDPADASIGYPVAAGLGAPEAPGAELLGRGRSRVLHHAGAAVTTSELSRRLGLAASTVSHHLAVLHHAGLVSRTRDGREVFYRRTEAGERLLDAGQHL
jgi:DNA-binding transcriptional ArsR family regulator